MAGDVPGHHGGPAAERRLRGAAHDVAVEAESREAARSDPVRIRDAEDQEVQHHHRHDAVP